MIAERVLPLSGVHNFRDYGGYAVEGGGRLRDGAGARPRHGGHDPLPFATVHTAEQFQDVLGRGIDSGIGHASGIPEGRLTRVA